MKFSHTADCHLGGHRDPRLKTLTHEAFEIFITQSIEDTVDFCIIAGDLFNTSLPGIDTLKHAIKQLQRLKEKHIPVYLIPGSHDYSPSGKTMLDVLEEAQLIINVYNAQEQDEGLHLTLTTDPSTGVHLTGILGKRGMLDQKLYKNITVEQKDGKKIFLFHTLLEELKPQRMAHVHGQPLSFLPQGFDYYAGGHVHIIKEHDTGSAKIVYPGPLFPNSFAELEELNHGGYFLYDNGALKRKDIILKRILPLRYNAHEKDAFIANDELTKRAKEIDPNDAIVLVRITGKLKSGTPSDIDLRGIVKDLETRGAHCVLRNTAKLTAQDFSEQKIEHGENIEERLLTEHKEQLALPNRDGIALAQSLMKALGKEQDEGEKVYEYQERVTSESLDIIERHN